MRDLEVVEAQVLMLPFAVKVCVEAVVEIDVAWVWVE